MRTLLTMAVLIGAVSCSGSTSKTTQSVEIVAKEYSFTPSTVAIDAGPVVFSVRNEGKEEHELEILSGTKVVDEVEDIAAGLTLELRATLKAGTYTMVCKLPGHEEKGMKGTLTVT